MPAERRRVTGSARRGGCSRWARIEDSSQVALDALIKELPRAASPKPPASTAFPLSTLIIGGGHRMTANGRAISRRCRRCRSDRRRPRPSTARTWWAWFPPTSTRRPWRSMNGHRHRLGLGVRQGAGDALGAAFIERSAPAATSSRDQRALRTCAARPACCPLPAQFLRQPLVAERHQPRDLRAWTSAKRDSFHSAVNWKCRCAVRRLPQQAASCCAGGDLAVPCSPGAGSPSPGFPEQRARRPCAISKAEVAPGSDWKFEGCGFGGRRDQLVAA